MGKDDCRCRGGGGNVVVLKTNPELAAGWWMVQAGQFTAVYLLAPGGKARWRDPWNHKWGIGTWKLGPTSLEIVWTATGTKESWLLKDMGSGLQDFGIPALRVTGQMEGTCIMKGYGTLSVKALKINADDVQTVVGTRRVSVHEWVIDEQGKDIVAVAAGDEWRLK